MHVKYWCTHLICRSSGTELTHFLDSVGDETKVNITLVYVATSYQNVFNWLHLIIALVLTKMNCCVR